MAKAGAGQAAIAACIDAIEVCGAHGSLATEHALLEKWFRDIKVYDIDGKSVRNGKRFVQLDIPGTGAPSAADGIRCDVDGNIWAGARPGVQVISANGERIGMIRLPETCANVCFGGAKRNRLFMAASQSLYVVYVETAGAHIA